MIPAEDEEIMKQAAVALWVLDSSQTNATAEDVFAYAGTEKRERTR